MAIPIGPLVRKYRERHRMTQQDLVDYTGLDRSASYFSSIETGRTSPTLVELEAIARVFRTPLLDFIAEAGEAASSAPRQGEPGESERAAALIKEDMQYMGPVRVSDVEAAQQRIVDIVRRLEEAGEVIIEGRGGDAELLV